MNYTNRIIRIKKLKMFKVGHSWAFRIPADFLKHTQLDVEKEYDLAIKEHDLHDDGDEE